MAVDPQYIARFKRDFLDLSSSDVFLRYIVPEQCAGLTDVDEHGLRARIAAKFEVELGNVIIVGSAKLGFTLRSKQATAARNERPAFSLFCENSDVDVAIVSDALFDSIWKKCLEYWYSSGYARATAYWPQGKSFRD